MLKQAWRNAKKKMSGFVERHVIADMPHHLDTEKLFGPRIEYYNRQTGIAHSSIERFLTRREAMGMPNPNLNVWPGGPLDDERSYDLDRKY